MNTTPHSTKIMDIDEACKFLGLDASTPEDQRHETFRHLRTRFEDKIALAPTPELKDEFLAYLAKLKEAIELVEFANEEADLSALSEGDDASELELKKQKFWESLASPEDSIEVIGLAAEGASLQALNEEELNTQEEQLPSDEPEDVIKVYDLDIEEEDLAASGEDEATEDLEEAFDDDDDDDQEEEVEDPVLRIEKVPRFAAIRRLFHKIDSTSNKINEAVSNKILETTSNRYVKKGILAFLLIALVTITAGGWWWGYESPRRLKATELVEYAQGLEGVKAWSKAADLYEQALDARSGWPEAIDGLIRVKLKLASQIKSALTSAQLEQDNQNWRKALGHFKQAARLDPDDPKIKDAISKLEQLIATLVGDLVVKTDPEGATVSFGKRNQQISPASYQDMNLGTYTVTVNKKGYRPIKTEILLKKGENVLGPLYLERIKGALSINTKPQGANYVISQVASAASADKNFIPRRGKAPTLESELPTGEYLIKIDMLGWMDDQINVRVTSVQQEEVNIPFTNLDAQPDLLDPETLSKILEGALDINVVQLREAAGEKLAYAPNHSSPHTGWIKDMHGNAQVRSLFSVKDGKKQGLLTSWHANGQKSAEINYQNGKLHGSEIHWREDGQKMSEIHYEEGKLHGPEIHWRKDGKKKSETHYAHGQKHGLEIYWREDGNKELETDYTDGKKNGLTTEWHINGQKKRESTYAEDRLHGLSTLWDKNGRQKSRIDYKDGQRHGLTTEWHDNGQKSSETDWEDGKPHGLSIRWDEKGNKRSETRYKHGQIVR